jgi:hypothetical protein
MSGPTETGMATLGSMTPRCEPDNRFDSGVTLPLRDTVELDRSEVRNRRRQEELRRLMKGLFKEI